MSDAKFGFQDKGKLYHPAWMSPEGMNVMNVLNALVCIDRVCQNLTDRVKISSIMLTNSFVITALQKRQSEINFKAADMWSFAIILWELATRNVPFADLSPMEAGMKVSA